MASGIGLAAKNGAIRQLDNMKGSTSNTYYGEKKGTEEVATTQANADTKDLEDKFNNQDKTWKTVWIAGGVTVALIVLFVLALKYKWIRL